MQWQVTSFAQGCTVSVVRWSVSLSLLLLSVFSFGDKAFAQSVSPAVPFTLHMINASHNIPQLDLQLFIDGELKEVLQLSNQGSSLLFIPPHKTFTFDLAPGSHTLTFRSQKGAFERNYPLKIQGPLWGLFGYEYWSGEASEMPIHYIEFYLQEDPIRFQ